MTINLFLFLAITAILFTSPLASEAFADDKKTFEEMCAKKKGNSPDALFCQAILGLQQSTDSFFDIFTELQESTARSDSFFDVFFDVFPDTPDKSGIDSFFDVFTELRATDTSLQTQIDSFENQDCPDGYYVYGIDEDGQIKCKPLPSDSNLFCGDNIVTAPETCDDGNTINGDGCSATCSTEGAQCTDGQPIGEQTLGDCQELVLCQEGNTVSIPDDSDIPSLPVSSCMQGTCSAGASVSIPLTSGTVCSVDGGFCDGAGSCVVPESCGDTNPVCSTSFPIPSVSGDIGDDYRVITDNEEKWYSLTIREDSGIFGEPPEAGILLESDSGDNYDLYVYCETCGGTLIASSTFPAGLSDFASVRSVDDSVFGGDNTFTVLIEVRAVSVNSCSDYTLTVSGNIVSEYGDLGLC